MLFKEMTGLNRPGTGGEEEEEEGPMSSGGKAVD